MLSLVNNISDLISICTYPLRCFSDRHQSFSHHTVFKSLGILSPSTNHHLLPLYRLLNLINISRLLAAYSTFLDNSFSSRSWIASCFLFFKSLCSLDFLLVMFKFIVLLMSHLVDFIFFKLHQIYYLSGSALLNQLFFEVH